MDNLNIFHHAPKELVTDAFFTWLFYYLDSEENFSNEKDVLFNELLLKEEDKGKKVSNITVNKQVASNKGRADIILSFDIENELVSILFENKTWSTTNFNQLNSYQSAHPNLYKYIYLKLAYVNYEEEKLTKQCNYDIIDVFKICKVLEKIKHIHTYISDYYDYIKNTFEQKVNSFEVEIFNNNNPEILLDSQAQQFLLSHIYKKLDGELDNIEFHVGSSSGKPWTQIYFGRTDNVYNGNPEIIFWRIDRRNGSYYIRLNQYAYVDNRHKEKKLKRLGVLRKIINDIILEYDVNKGVVRNSALKECEIAIFFLNNNNIKDLIDIIPDISTKFIKEYENTNFV